jgi:translation initiation factor 2B subunit (eIF-2B alpha/beta/delta family)
MKWINRALKFFKNGKKEQYEKRDKLEKVVEKLKSAKDKLHEKCKTKLTKKERNLCQKEFKAVLKILKKAKKRLKSLNARD